MDTRSLVRWESDIFGSALYQRSADWSNRVRKLRHRYTRGEIDTTTYEQMRAHLETPERQPAEKV